MTRHICRSLGVGILLTGFLSGCGGDQNTGNAAPVARPVKTMVVGGGFDETRTFPGRVEAGQRANLSFRVGGPLIDLPVEKGQRVAKGELIARIDPRDYEIARQQANATYTKAEADFRRFQELYERDAVALTDLELKRAHRDVTRAQLDDAEANLRDTTLRAPFAGIVGERYVENFEDVQAKQQIARLQNFEMVDIIIDVSENMIAEVRDKTGLVAVATFEAAPGREFPLTLKEVAAQADVTTRTYQVTLTMPQPEGLNVLEGMTGLVRATHSSPPGDTSVFVIPAAALVGEDSSGQYVWVVDDGLAVHKQSVSIGEVTGTQSIEITGGLEGGERIAIAAVHHLREGMKIRLMD